MSDGLALAGTPESPPNTQVTEKPSDQEQAGSSLEKFWAEFCLSPRGLEQAVLTQPLWLSLVAVGPLILLIGFSLVRAYGSPDIFALGFADLDDPIFSYITLSLSFAALLYSLGWYPCIRPSFESLLANKVIYADGEKPVSEAEYVAFLQGYRTALHSSERYRYPVGFALLLLASTLWVTIGRDSWPRLDGTSGMQVVTWLHFLTRWVLAPTLWGFVGGLGLRAVVITARQVDLIAKEFHINVSPYHSDRAGGLKKIGDLCAAVGLIVVVIAIPAIFLAAQKTSAVVGAYHCGAEIREFIADETVDMTQERFATCVYYSQDGALGGLNYAGILEEIGGTVTADVPLRSVARDYYESHARLFQREVLLRAYDIFYVMDFFIVVILIFAVFIVVRPMWEIHQDMLAYRQSREREANDRLGDLYHKLTGLIDEDKVEEAGKVKEHIQFYTGELAEIQKYPAWPISQLPVLRTYLTSSLLSAVVTYLLSILKITLSPEVKGIVSNLINP